MTDNIVVVATSTNTVVVGSNSPDAMLLARANHTGTQSIATVSGLQASLDAKAPIADPTFTGTVTAPAIVGALTGNASSATTLATGADRTKLDGIAAGATANSTDATLLARASHTGTQSIATVSGLQTSLDAKAPLASPTFTGTVTAPAIVGALTGNAATATALATPRLINGITFDGTRDIDTALVKTASAGLVIPYYLYPNNPYSDTSVQRLLGLIRQHHGVPVIVVINPSNGPGTALDGNYSAFIKVLQAAGAIVVGYVSTGYATGRTEAAVKADIDAWGTIYSATPVDGIFLDEQTWDTGPGNTGDDYVQLYKRYTDYCHSKNYWPVIGNPGTNQQPAYFQTKTSDIIIVHESGTWPDMSAMAGNFAGGHTDYKHSRRGALVYGQSSLDTALLRELSRYVQWLYVTSDVLTPNPWDSLPTYLEGLFAAVSIPDGTQAALDLKAPIASPTFTGTVTAPAIVGALTGNASSATVLATGADRTKLDGIATGATANSTDAVLLARANHTGTQAISTISGLQAAIDAKAPIASPTFTGTVTSPAFAGDLTGNASTATTLATGADRTKLDGIAAGATANSTDAVLLARANHTGTQLVTTISNLGTGTVTATGGTTARALSDHHANEIWAIDQGVTFNGTTDDKATLQAAMTAAAAAGKTLRLSPGTIRMTGTLTCPTGLTMIYTGDPADCLFDFAYTGSAQDMIKVLNVSDVWLEGFSLNAHQSVTLTNGNCLDVTGSTNVTLRRLYLYNSPDEGMYISGSTKVSFIDGLVTGSQSSGIYILGGSSDVTIENIDVTSNLGFGIFADNASHLYLRHNRCTTSSLELIGIRYNCSHGEIIGNHAVGTGDNGISITGQYFTVTDNICHNNYNCGIWIYGHSNTVTGNVCYNNGQNGGGGGNYAGVRVSAAFGGIASNNTVTGNVCFDNQTVKTQKWGVQLGNGSAYGSWTTATVYTALTYVVNGANLYLATAGGTSGATAPVHTSGTVSDGAVSWLYINTSVGSFQASHNQVGGNQCYNNATSDYQNDTTNNLNNFHAVGSLTAHTNASTNTIGLTLRNANVSSNSGVGITFNCSTTDTVESAKIRGIRTNSPAGGATYLDFLTEAGSGLTRRLRIREEGAVEVSVKLNLATLTAAPYTPTNGDIAYADGTSWNPTGAGAGVYAYVSGAWTKL